MNTADGVEAYIDKFRDALLQVKVDEYKCRQQLAEARAAYTDKETQYLATCDVIAQADVVLTTLRRELAAAQAALEDVVKNQPSCFDSFNHIQVWDYGAWMTKHKAALKAVKDFGEQVKISNEIVAEVIEEERAARKAP